MKARARLPSSMATVMHRTTHRTMRLSTRRAITTCATLLVTATTTTLPASPAQAQDAGKRDSTAFPQPTAASAALLLAAGAALDRPMRKLIANRGHSAVVNALSTTGNDLGTAGHIIPLLAGSYLAERIAGRRRVADDIVDAAAGYAASDIVEGLLKSAVGRERPMVSGNPERFHPFTSRGDFHSFPSGHMTHIASIAAAAAIESHEPWVRVLGISATTLVGWQRIHVDQHWTSDVIAGTLLGDFVSSEVVHRLRRLHGHPFGL
jgi:membrane-associated phospholipid phosphatase